MRETRIDLWRWLGLCPHTLHVLEPDRKLTWILSDEDHRMGFIRPLRYEYMHLRCRRVTQIGPMLARVWARRPTHYHEAYCASCKKTWPAGWNGEFVWKGSSERVGT